jgi:hypothetical protein
MNQQLQALSDDRAAFGEIAQALQKILSSPVADPFELEQLNLDALKTQCEQRVTALDKVIGDV